jgi:hypothetical protein
MTTEYHDHERSADPGRSMLSAAQARLEDRRKRAGLVPAPDAATAGSSVGTSAPELEAENPYGPPLPEGEYPVAFLRAPRRVAYGRNVLFAYFKIVDGRFTGRVLIRFYNVPSGSRLPRSSSLWRDFLAVTGTRPPSRPFDLSWAFSECVLRAQVVTVDSRPANGARVPMLEAERYSKVDALLALESHSPPVLRGCAFRPLRRKSSTSTGTSTTT